MTSIVSLTFIFAETKFLNSFKVSVGLPEWPRDNKEISDNMIQQADIGFSSTWNLYPRSKGSRKGALALKVRINIPRVIRA